MLEKLRTPEYLLIALAVAASLAFSVWHALLNNFAVEQAAFTGREIGILQSLREIPGFLAFTVVFVLLEAGRRGAAVRRSAHPSGACRQVPSRARTPPPLAESRRVG